MQLRVDARVRRLLARLPVVNVYSLAELVLIAALATQGARLVWTIVTPVDPIGDWRPAALAVPGDPRDIVTGFDPFFRIGGASGGPAQVTSLQLTLFGTRIDEASGRGSAIIAGPDGVQNSIAVGDEVAAGVRLKSVAFDHVTLDRGGTAEDLFMVQGDAIPAGPGVSGPSAIGTPPPVGMPPGGGIRIGQLQSEIGFIPRIDGGRVSGLVVRAQGTGAAFRQAGLREGDIVTAIAGRPVAGPQDIERVAADYAKGGNIPLTVERGNETLPLAIAIAPTP